MIKGKQEFSLLSLDDFSPLDNAVEKLESKLKLNVKYTLYLLDEEKQRSLSANKYYWGVVLKLISNETGESAENFHEYFKFKFNPKEMEVNGKTVTVGGETKKMKQEEFMEVYVDKIRLWAMETLNCYIPLPQEVIEHDYSDLYVQANHLKK